jgi:hypothetical protein
MDNMYVFVNIIGHFHDRLSGGRQRRDRDLEVAMLFHEQDTSRIEVFFGCESVLSECCYMRNSSGAGDPRRHGTVDKREVAPSPLP